jgi:translation initiation factor 2B subunit (eIF-2B alpha/beta/delta family)
MKAESIVREIARDRRRGATALALRALDALSASRGAAAALLAARPSMPLLAAAVRMAEARGVAAARRELRGREERLLERAREVLPPGGRYCVFGRSGTVEAAVRAVGGRIVRDLPADVGLVGADALLPDGDFVNAEGTGAFLRRCRREGKCGVFAVAVTLKRVSGAPVLEKGFELVPGRVVHAVLTEEGLVYPPMGRLAGVDPSWMDRGRLDPRGGAGRCHPHHGSR